ncbi:acyltransferase [uncultured Kriegella sp.]|uniref:acyltransferase n=1 Tax=uncultured Kriegella sp. TaxID=1798910 RepID=UPI0030DA7EDB
MKGKKFLYHMHYFRAFAILNIMMDHVWLYPVHHDKTNPDAILIESAREAFFGGSTIYFIIISGFLFHHLKFKFTIPKYYISKIKNVVSPYVFFSVLILALTTFLGSVVNSSILDFLASIPNVLIHGTALGPFWYIPFIIPIFVVSPLLLKIPEKTFIKIAPFLFLLPLLGTRTGTTLSFGLYLYLFPIYLMGFYLSMNYSLIMSKVSQYRTQLGIIAVLAIITTFYFRMESIDDINRNLYQSVLYIKNISISMVVLSIMKKNEDKRSRLLNSLANYSFALFFLHDFINYKVIVVSRKISSLIDYNYTFIWSLIWAIFVIALTWLLCIIGKKITGKYSRPLMGA